MKKVLKCFLNLALVLGLACTASFGQEGRDTRNLIVDDYFRIHSVSDPQISPDGKWVAFAVSTMNLEEDESESRIWILPVEGGEAIPMTAKGSSASRPRWSPDGKYLSFLAARDDDKACFVSAKFGPLMIFLKQRSALFSTYEGMLTRG
jgi:Tol biopolymer transport system component